MLAARPADILQFILDREDERIASVLVTLTGIEGSSPRALGAQMAVAADGRYAGSLSGGCVEAAVVAEAIDTLAAGEARCVRFGAGSPYFDIRLPCGAGIDLLFTPRPDARLLGHVSACLRERTSAALALSHAGVSLAESSAARDTAQEFIVTYVPALRLIALGEGEDLMALTRLARSFGAEVLALTPSKQTVAALRHEGIDADELVGHTMLPAFDVDPWTAILSLFHDRDWEDALLPHLLAAPAFYHGAVGSRRTQERRKQALRAAGVDEEVADKLHGPVGTIPAARDPATLALSILSDVVLQYRRRFDPDCNASGMVGAALVTS